MTEASSHRSAAAEKLEGAQLIKDYLRNLPNAPGVYRMLGAKEDVLYVGKAKSLKKRVASYTKPQGLSSRLQRMVALTRSMEFVTTNSEVEALLLESNLIKKLKPSFNIILRDDKSFPYIYLRHDHDFAMIGKHRGARKKDIDYFGPFASASAVNETLSALLRAFPLRNCSDSIFENRKRPCLQYQIKRCSAPCVGRIGKEEYGEIVNQVQKFLSGDTKTLLNSLKTQMNEAAEALDFEKAAMLRDRIKSITHVSSRQEINVDKLGNVDIFAVYGEGGQFCVQVFFYRNGQNYGNKAHYPAHTKERSNADVLQAFLTQFYSERPAPRSVFINEPLFEQALVEEALSFRNGHPVKIQQPQRGSKLKLVDNALANAKAALGRKLAEEETQGRLLNELAKKFNFAQSPTRIEVYDNSHIQGSHATGAFIVATPQGFERRSYRTFNIKDPETGTNDDFAMMREVIKRRFTRLLKEDPEKQSGHWPDLVIIDGGAGQLSSVLDVLQALEIKEVHVMAVAKGPERDAGEEHFYLKDRGPLALAKTDAVLYYIQRLRDEVHRFVISTHRNKRAKTMGKSRLDQIPGIGAKRKKALISHFGSPREVEGASLQDLELVPGISRTVAREIYDYFHERG